MKLNCYRDSPTNQSPLQTPSIPLSQFRAWFQPVIFTEPTPLFTSAKPHYSTLSLALALIATIPRFCTPLVGHSRQGPNYHWPRVSLCQSANAVRANESGSDWTLRSPNDQRQTSFRTTPHFLLLLDRGLSNHDHDHTFCIGNFVTLWHSVTSPVNCSFRGQINH